MKRTITITMLLVVVCMMFTAIAVQADEFTYHPDFVLVPAYIELDLSEYVEVPYILLDEYATDNIACKAIYVQINHGNAKYFIKREVEPNFEEKWFKGC